MPELCVLGTGSQMRKEEEKEVGEPCSGDENGLGDPGFLWEQGERQGQQRSTKAETGHHHLSKGN